MPSEAVFYCDRCGRDDIPGSTETTLVFHKCEPEPKPPPPADLDLYRELLYADHAARTVPEDPGTPKRLCTKKGCKKQFPSYPEMYKHRREDHD